MPSITELPHNALEQVQITPSAFQELQSSLSHHLIADVVPSGCSYHDVLAEALVKLNVSVVLDKHTSCSRTTWLAGKYNDRNTLVVIDAFEKAFRNYVSIDVWTDDANLAELISLRLAESRIGDVSIEPDDLDTSWIFEYTQSSVNLVITLKSTNGVYDFPLTLEIDYQGLVTEKFATSIDKDKQVSVSLEVTEYFSIWGRNLGDPFITIVVSDSSTWKLDSSAKRIIINWKDALLKVLRSKIDTDLRFSSLEEIAKELHFSGENRAVDVRDLYVSYCLNQSLKECTADRTSDHCKRAAILTGLVIAFNPDRGLTGYLEMLRCDSGSSDLIELGSERTWRNHLTEIVHATNDFIPHPIAIAADKKSQKPGRPPLQLIPSTPLSNLLKTFIEKPELLVCKYCKFSTDS